MKTNTWIKTVILMHLVIILLVQLALALPVGPSITYVQNSTSSSAGSGTLRDTDDGGYIYTLLLDTLQQNFGWKAYVGNVTGKFTLDDANNFTIYDWTLANPSMEVYISRNQNVGWATVNCSNRSVIEAEDLALGKQSSSEDSINSTFSGTTHKSFVVAGNTITNSNCPAIATYVNDSSQSNGESNLFQEILLADSSSNLVYAAIAENDVVGYDNQSTFDFQAIIADDEANGVITAYYFYVELGG